MSFIYSEQNSFQEDKLNVSFDSENSTTAFEIDFEELKEFKDLFVNCQDEFSLACRRNEDDLLKTVEVANVMATYADFIYGSEEMEPGSGWDYTAIGNYLAENNDAHAASLGKQVCDSFFASCEESGDDALATFSVIDLSKIDELLISFNKFAKNMYEAGEDSAAIAEMIRGIESADNFGGNNKSEGYTNMVAHHMLMERQR